MLGVQHNRTFCKQRVHYPWMYLRSRRIPFSIQQIIRNEIELFTQ